MHAKREKSKGLLLRIRHFAALDSQTFQTQTDATWGKAHGHSKVYRDIRRQWISVHCHKVVYGHVDTRNLRRMDKADRGRTQLQTRSTLSKLQINVLIAIATLEGSSTSLGSD